MTDEIGTRYDVIGDKLVPRDEWLILPYDWYLKVAPARFDSRYNPETGCMELTVTGWSSVIPADVPSGE